MVKVTVISSGGGERRDFLGWRKSVVCVLLVRL